MYWYSIHMRVCQKYKQHALVRATVCGTIELPLQGDRFYKPFHPGRCPGHILFKMFI